MPPEPGAAFRDAAGAALARRDHRAAGKAAEKALVVDPGDVIARYWRALAGVETGAEGAAARDLALALKSLPRRRVVPLHRELFALRGLAKKRLGETATGDLQRAVLLDPGRADALFTLGNLRDEHGRADEAIRAFRLCAIAEPSNRPALANLGRLLGIAGRTTQAEHWLRCALALDPAAPHALRSLGLEGRRRDDGCLARRWFARALAVDPRWRDVHGELGRALLRSGELARGWPHLARFRPDAFEPPVAGLPLWDGDALTGGPLLLWCADRIGDELLFSIFLERARRRAGRVVLLAEPRNRDFLARRHPEVRVVTDRDELAAGEAPAAGYPLDFVGRFFADRPDAMRDPYAQPARPLAPPDGRRLEIGISWKSEASLIGALKSTRLADWAPLLRLPGCRFRSLQYGETEADLAEARTAGFAIEEIADFDPFGPTGAFARTVTGLDLVVTVANTTAHVAGLAGVPLFVLLPKGFGCSWFWFEEREDSPLYASARLFRQSRAGDWPPVLAEVARTVESLLAGSGRK